MDFENVFSAGAASRSAAPALDLVSRALVAAALATQCAHLAGLVWLPRHLLLSNLLQVMAALLAVTVCLYKVCQPGPKYERRLWGLLAAGFLIWSTAQVFYLAGLLGWLLPHSFLISDVLWLFFAFPLGLVASSSPRSSKRDLVSWLDAAQAFIFFVVLYALVFPRPGTIPLALAFQLQGLAMLPAFALSYSTTRRRSEQELYHGFAIFVISYASCSVLGYAGWNHGFAPGSLVDLCWSVPFTTFSTVALFAHPAAGLLEPSTIDRAPSSGHVRGISALVLALMSLSAASVLWAHRPAAGALIATIVFLLFAARTSTREWQLHKAHERLSHEAVHDPLTGLGNWSMLQRNLTSRLAACDQNSGPGFALLFIDLDRFKTINDGLGHAFGDRLLCRVASLLESAARSQDMVVRHGGDEFVLLLDQVKESEAEALAQHVTKMLREPLMLEGRLIHVTASIGLVVAEPGATADSLLQDADCAMYKAKVQGKDRVQTFAPSMLVDARSRLGLETDLRASLAQCAISVAYQPIYRLRPARSILRDSRTNSQQSDHQWAQKQGKDTIQGFEALARWRHPSRGIVSPADFIPIAEDTGLIIELGKQVLREACFQCQAWNQRYGTRLTINVNVSALQFAHPGLLDDIKAILRLTGLDPRLLKLEITESVLLSQYEAAASVLSRARALGIAVCLDDFGTGYSSLSYLLRFPFDVVKIDRSLVHQLDRDHRRTEMVRMVVRLAATLKKQIVAEGVEVPSELARLRALGCDMVQGFLLSGPQTAQAVDRLLEAEFEDATGSPPRLPPGDKSELDSASRAWMLSGPIATRPAQ